jgi:hypothetical protein
MDSKEPPRFTSRISESTHQSCAATAHSKNKCKTDSSLQQNKQETSYNFLLLLKLSLVSTLFLDNNHKKISFLLIEIV